MKDRFSSSLKHALLVIGSTFLLLWAGCSVAKETTGESELEESPAVTSPLRPVQPSSPDTIGTPTTRLTSKQDTLTASVVQYSRSVAPSVSKSEDSFVTAFTIQVGAFANASNALLLLKKTKERIGEIPVLNRFEPRDRLYRVSVGLFETREGAIAYQQTLIKTYGPDFKDSWVSQISK